MLKKVTLQKDSEDSNLFPELKLLIVCITVVSINLGNKPWACAS